MPKKKMAKKKAVKKQTTKKPPAKKKTVKKQTKKADARKKAANEPVATPAKLTVPEFPSASSLADLREEHIAHLATVSAVAPAVVDDPPGACVTVDTSGRMSCRITRQSMCTGPNSKFFPGKACPA
jgi:hypothetical protein